MGDHGGGRDDEAGRSPFAVLSEAARVARCAENSAAAERVRACHALFRQCLLRTPPEPDARPGYAVLDPFDECVNQLVALFAVSVARATTMLGLSLDLCERCPDILAALTAGRIDLTAAERLVRLLRNVDPSVIDRVQREAVAAYLDAVEAGRRLGAAAVGRLIDKVIARHDPDGIRDRAKDAAADRGVRVHKDGDGMSTVQAGLTADESAVLVAALDARAELLHPEDPSGAGIADPDRPTLAARRADALMSLALGENPAGGSADPSPPGTPAPAPVLRPQITVIARPGTAPTVQFPRTGASTIAALLDLLAGCHGATLTVVDPTPGAHDDPDRAHTYRPTAALARAIRLRDGTCRHPGCTVPAENCDLDHAIPFDHDDPAGGGPTTEWNILAECRRHHRFKTFSDWTYTLAPDGTLTIETPDGRRITTEPSGPLADFRAADTAAAAEADNAEPTAPDPTAEPEPGPTYFTRRAARMRAERRRTTERRRNTTRPAARTAGHRRRPRPRRTESRIEFAIATLLADHHADRLDPPPF